MPTSDAKKRIVCTYGELVFKANNTDTYTKQWGLWCSVRDGFYISHGSVPRIYRDLQLLMLGMIDDIEGGK